MFNRRPLNVRLVQYLFVPGYFKVQGSWSADHLHKNWSGVWMYHVKDKVKTKFIWTHEIRWIHKIQWQGVCILCSLDELYTSVPIYNIRNRSRTYPCVGRRLGSGGPGVGVNSQSKMKGRLSMLPLSFLCANKSMFIHSGNFYQTLLIKCHSFPKSTPQSTQDVENCIWGPSNIQKGNIPF